MYAKFSRILFPTDFSKDAAHAWGFVQNIARDYGSDVIVLHVIQPIFIPALHQAPAQVSMQAVREAAKKELKKLVEKADLDAAKVRTLVREGSPDLEIAAVAADEGSDLIVMATHGYSGLTHVVLGSTAERTVRQSPVPVLVVRHPDRAT